MKFLQMLLWEAMKGNVILNIMIMITWWWYEISNAIKLIKKEYLSSWNVTLVSDEGLKRYTIIHNFHWVTHQISMVNSVVWDTSNRYSKGLWNSHKCYYQRRWREIFYFQGLKLLNEDYSIQSFIRIAQFFLCIVTLVGNEG